MYIIHTMHVHAIAHCHAMSSSLQGSIFNIPNSRHSCYCEERGKAKWWSEYPSLPHSLHLPSSLSPLLPPPPPPPPPPPLPQMNGGMIRGSDVYADLASDENGYVELPPEAASNPWSVLGRYLCQP